MIIATLSNEGLCRKDGKSAIYLLKFRNPKSRKVVQFYIGRTMSSNRKGESSPFGRLATHLRKTGKTQSCIWDLLKKKIGKEKLNNIQIDFYAVPVPKNYIKDSEDWILQKLREKELLLNKRPPEKPVVKKPWSNNKELNKLYNKMKLLK